MSACAAGDAGDVCVSFAPAFARWPAFSASCCVFVVLATIASILATAGLGLIAFVPLVGLARVLPLQFAAWLLRGFVFQYLALTALGAYLTQYRHYRAARARAAIPEKRSGMINYDAFFSRSAERMRESAIRKMGTVLAQGRDIISFAPGYPAARDLSRGMTSRRSPPSCCRARMAAFCSTVRPAATGRCSRRHRRRSWSTAARAPRWTGCWSRPDRSRGSIWSRACSSIRAMSSWWSCPTYTGAITAFRNAQAEMVGVPQEGDGIDPRGARRHLRAPCSARTVGSRCSTSSPTSRTRPGC